VNNPPRFPGRSCPTSDREGVKIMRKVIAFCERHTLALIAGVGTFVSGVLYSGVANATAVIDLTSVTTTVEKEITENLPTIEVVFGILLTIAVLFRLYRRFVN
jgi:hypothetical protein